MFAQRKLRTGKLILVEHPILVMPYVVAPGTSVSGIYQQMFDLLSKHLRRELLDLAVSAFRGGEYVDEKEVYESIVRINTLAISFPVSHVGLVNHREPSWNGREMIRPRGTGPHDSKMDYLLALAVRMSAV